MAHRHAVGIVFTGPDIEDGPRGHYHMVPGGAKTSTNPDGPKHTHSVPGGKKTTGPLPMKGKGPGDHMDDAKAKKKKKKDKKPKRPWY